MRYLQDKSNFCINSPPFQDTHIICIILQHLSNITTNYHPYVFAYEVL